MKILKINRQESEATDLSYSFNQNRVIYDQQKSSFLGLGIAIFFLLLFAGLPTLNAQTIVNPGADLNAIIENSSGGTIIVNSGTYSPLLVTNKNFTATNPLIIRAADGAIVKIEREGAPNKNWNLENPHTGSRDAAVFTRCSYIAFDNIKFSGGGIEFTGNDRGVWIHNSNHLIFRNCEFTQTQQEGVKVEAKSEYIDFINCVIANTGMGPNTTYGEGLYVGRGSYTNSPQNWPDASKYVWVEGCEFYNTGRAEAINIKAEVFGCTIRKNYIHNITLNSDDSGQTNEGAISLDHSYEIQGENYREGERRENWIEYNTITNVRTGFVNNTPDGVYPTPRIAAIYSAGTGNRIVGNIISDVTNNFTHPANGIRFNNLSNNNTQNYIWNNDVTNTDDGNAFGNLAINNDPGTNPNSAQNWYPTGNNNNNENEGVNLRIEAEDGTFTQGLLKSSNEASANEYVGQFSNNGDYVEVTANIETAGQYELRIGYRAPYSEQQNDILIGGEFVKKFEFAQTDDFASASIGTFAFEAGRNTIMFRKSWGWMDVDYFEIVGAGGNPDPVVNTGSSIKIEAEDGTYSNNLLKSSNEASANEYVGQFSNNGDYVEVTANIETAGQYELKIGYRAPYSDQQNDILIGGEFVKKFEFKQSDTFQAVSIGTYDFVAGANTIMFRKSWGWMDVDYFEIIGASGSDGANNIPPVVINTGYEIIINAKGTCGGEKIEVSVNGNVEKEFTLTANETAYPISFQGNSVDNVKIAFINDGSSNTCPDRNLFVNKIEIDGTVIETENVAVRDGCGNAEWLWCGGSFSFGSLSLKLATKSEQGKLMLFPNPLSTQSLKITFDELKVSTNVQVSIYNIDGAEVYTKSVISNGLINLTNMPRLESGIYMVRAVADNFQYQAKLNIQ